MLEKWKSFFKENRFLIILSILIFVYTTYFYNKGLENVDEGVLNVGASRIAEGEIPYRDFFIPVTPLSFYYVAFFFKIFGTSLFIARFSAILVSFFYIFSIFLLSKRYLNLPFSLTPLIFLTQAGMASWHIASHHFISNIFTILAFYFLSFYEEKNKPLYLFLSGLFSSFSFLTLNDQGLFTITIIFLIIFLEKKSFFSKEMKYFLVPNLLIVSLFFTYFLIKVPLKTLIYDLLIFPLTAYKSIESNSPSFFAPFLLIFGELANILKGEFIFHNLISSITSFSISAIPILNFLLFIYIYVKEKEKKSIFLFLASLTMFFTAIRRWAPINLIWATPLPVIFFSYALQKFYQNYQNSLKKLFLFLCYFFITIFSIFGISYLFIWFKFSAQVNSKNGKLYLLDIDLAQKYNSLFLAIDQLIKEDEEIFCEALPSIYFLTKKKNPSKIDCFKPPHYTPPHQIEEVISDLEGKKIKFIITFKKEKLNNNNPFESYLSANFREIWENQLFSIYKRKSQ